jgi:lipid II:glycine glycyltransferase (peptidoglycan interpeptide bridge formation enzyme)
VVLKRNSSKAVVVLDLRLGPEALFNQFHENRKRNIRIAIRNGVEVFEATDDDFAAYWNVYCGWLQTKRKKIHEHADRVVAAKAHKLTGNRRRFLARHRGKVIAATTIRFCPDGLVEYSSNCSLDEFISLRPNDPLIWETIRWACNHRLA